MNYFLVKQGWLEVYNTRANESVYVHFDQQLSEALKEKFRKHVNKALQTCSNASWKEIVSTAAFNFQEAEAVYAHVFEDMHIPTICF